MGILATHFMNTRDIVFPSHLQIETVNKICNANCIMCSIQNNSRKEGIMSLEFFKILMNRFLPYKEHFKFVTLHGCGEPLLDKTIYEKIKYTKGSGFKGIGFSSNCQELTKELSKNILNSGLDTLIVSIDGFTKYTHESIRVGTDFDTIVSNVRNYIKIRNAMNSKSKVIIRFICQKKNASEWLNFKGYWNNYINNDIGDNIIKFDVHNCAGKVEDFEKMEIANKEINVLCCDLFERIIIFVSGNYGFCSADQSGYFELGSAIKNDPISVFNNKIFRKYRKQMLKGNIMSLEHCANCSIPLSRYYKVGSFG